MNEIKIVDLTAGKFYTEPIYLDETYILTSPEIPIAKSLITSLQQAGFRTVLSNGKEVEKPSYLSNNISETLSNLTSNQIIDRTLDIKANDLRDQSVEYYLQTLKFFSRVFKNFAQTGELKFQEISDKVKEMQTRFTQDKETFLHLPDINTTNYLIVDAVKSTFFSIALADILKLPIHKQIEVSIAALLHDVGMFRIPSNLYLHDRKLTLEEIALIRNHVPIGAKLVKAAGFSQDIVQAIQEHHESFDGTGYPFKVSGQSISLYGRIVAMVCAYTAATSKRLFRTQKGNHFGIIDILQHSNKLYDPPLAKAFVLMLSIYPLGCFVELVDGKKGVVVKTSMNTPKTPVVKIMVESNGKPSESFPNISTAEEGSTIKRALNNEEILSVKNIFRFNNLVDKKSFPSKT